jgi:hypothetical protein
MRKKKIAVPPPRLLTHPHQQYDPGDWLVVRMEARRGENIRAWPGDIKDWRIRTDVWRNGQIHSYEQIVPDNIEDNMMGMFLEKAKMDMLRAMKRARCRCSACGQQLPTEDK